METTTTIASDLYGNMFVQRGEHIESCSVALGLPDVTPVLPLTPLVTDGLVVTDERLAARLALVLARRYA